MTISLKKNLALASQSLLKASESPSVRSTGLKLAGIVLSPAAFAAGQPGDWDIRTATLVYSETDRVSALEPVIEATRYFQNDRIFSSKLVVDVLTGASATGAVASDKFQTFTRPSGEGAYTVAPGETPLDDTFHDTRVALSANWTQPLMQNLTGTVGFNGSKEYDYLSLGLSGILNWDLNSKNTTLTFGGGFSSDQISPEGGLPTAGAEMAFVLGTSTSAPPESEIENAQDADNAERDGRDSSDSKTILDVLVGVTQVIDRRTLVQLNYSLSMADGYLTDPFKIYSVVDGNGDPVQQIYENRPDSRTKNSVFLRGKRNFRDRDVLDLSYRYLWDDWGMTSHTLDMRYRYALGERDFLQPHLRYYQQSATDFFRYYVTEGEAAPTEISADYRLGDLNTYTFGLEYGHTRQNGHEWRLALEYYLQSGSEPGNKPGNLAAQTLAPDVKAMMLRFNYDFSL